MKSTIWMGYYLQIKFLTINHYLSKNYQMYHEKKYLKSIKKLSNREYFNKS